MKNLKFIIAVLIIGLAIESCRNFEVTHPDFKYTSGYFPYQFPVRTLVLGNYIYDNANDNAHIFVISVHMGGVYKNEKDRRFNIEVDNSLCDSLLFNSGGDTIRPMPDKYYQLASNSIVIPKGEFNGGVKVQLTDAFFNDPHSIGLNYVVPIRLISSNDVDTLLMGVSTMANPDPRIVSDWVAAPKNFTIFAVKYINEYEGTYFHFGKSEVKDVSNSKIEDSTYKTEYIVKNPTLKLKTTKRNQVILNTTLYSQVIPINTDLLLTFNDNKCSISAMSGSPYTISGSGEFQKDTFEWGDKKRNGIILNYKVSDGSYTYVAQDTLVSRDRGVVMETFNPVKY